MKIPRSLCCYRLVEALAKRRVDLQHVRHGEVRIIVLHIQARSDNRTPSESCLDREALARLRQKEAT